MTVRANHRAGRRSWIQKCCWVAGTFGTAVSAMSKGDWDQGLSASTASADFDSCHLSCYPELETIDLRPVAAIRLLDNLFVNGGLDAMSPGVTLNPYNSSFPQFSSDGFENLMSTGEDGWRWGNIGLTWNISKYQHLFMTYRSPVEADYSGRFAADPIAAEEGVFPNSFSSAFNFPTVLGIGYGIALTETISLETDFALLDFLENQSLYFNTVNDPVLLTMGAKSASTPENPRNILASGVGADWKFAAHWALRARYDFFESPEHNSAFSPTTPDVNQHVITLGVAWKGKNSSLELAYAMDFYYDQHIANDQQPSFNGTYGFSGHILSMSYKFTF